MVGALPPCSINQGIGLLVTEQVIYLKYSRDIRNRFHDNGESRRTGEVIQFSSVSNAFRGKHEEAVLRDCKYAVVLGDIATTSDSRTPRTEKRTATSQVDFGTEDRSQLFFGLALLSPKHHFLAILPVSIIEKLNLKIN